MIIFMLNASCQDSICIKIERFAIFIIGKDRNSHRTDNIAPYIRNAQAPFLILHSLRGRAGYLRIDECTPHSIIQFNYEHTLKHTYLRTGKSDSGASLQSIEKILDKP